MDSEVEAILDSADVDANGKLHGELETNDEVGLVLVEGNLHVEARWPLFPPHFFAPPLLLYSTHSLTPDPFYGILILISFSSSSN